MEDKRRRPLERKASVDDCRPPKQSDGGSKGEPTPAEQLRIAHDELRALEYLVAQLKDATGSAGSHER